ncbi:MAG: hypothetical protein QOJ35_1407 [Solirubrobacteraceae bacterium]|nr:hypothetical protein [Solirubrobacteraceae bacterium]
MKKVSKMLKKQFKQITDHPIIAGGAVLAVVLVVGVLAALVLSGGDNGGGGNAQTSTAKHKRAKKDAGVEAAKRRKVKPAPIANGPGTVDTARSIGEFALAQGRGLIKHPSQISVRVSAAPKQTVTVDWQLSCYKAGHRTTTTKVGHARYRTRPPNTRALPLPISGADECTATVGAQLTRAGAGRIKVAVVSG